MNKQLIVKKIETTMNIINDMTPALSCSKDSQIHKLFHLRQGITILSSGDYVRTIYINKTLSVGQSSKTTSFGLNINWHKETQTQDWSPYVFAAGKMDYHLQECPDGVLERIDARISLFNHFMNKVLLLKDVKEPVDIEHIQDNLSVYAKLAWSSLDDFLFERLYSLENKKINQKLLQYCDLETDEMQNNTKIKKLNQFQFKTELEKKLTTAPLIKKSNKI